MQEFGSKVMADFFIESTLKDLNSTVYIFLRKRQESENYVVVSFFKKYQTYCGVNLYWMLKEKIKTLYCFPPVAIIAYIWHLLFMNKSSFTRQLR